MSFADVRGVIAAAETLDAALSEAAEALSFAAEDWETHSGFPFPAPRSLDTLREEPQFNARAQDAVVAAVPLALPVGHVTDELASLRLMRPGVSTRVFTQ